MIKKLDIPESTVIDASVLWGGLNDNILAAKINEMIDVINKQQDIIRQIGEWGSSKGECLWCDTLTEFNPKKPTISEMENVDPYAEQRKWEGKLCWFWDADPEDKIVDVLSCIDISDKYPYVMCDRQVHYKYCEPVKPDDDIIYKGE